MVRFPRVFAFRHANLHRVSEFAPRKYQRFLSYVSGWLATLSWQAGSAGGSFLIGSLIQGCIAQYDLNYLPKRWQGTLFVFAVTLIEGIINIFMVNWLPWLQTIMIVPHGLGWIAVIIFLAVLSPKASAHDVFLSFTSNGGWEPIGLSVVVGQITAVYFLIREYLSLYFYTETFVVVDVPSILVPSLWSMMLFPNDSGRRNMSLRVCCASFMDSSARHLGKKIPCKADIQRES